MNVKIIADSTCDLPEDLIKQYDIDIVNLYVILDEVSYIDKLEMTPDKLIEWSNQTKQTPKTSAPSIDDYLSAFKPYADKKQDIVFVSVSSVLSATCQNAFFASNMLEKATIKVVDGCNVTIGTGCVVLKAAQLAQAGKSADEIVEALEVIIPKVKASFVFDNLEFLKRGGRCSTVKAFSANALKIRPKIDVVGGKLIPGEKYRGSLQKVVLKFCGSMLENLNDIDPELVFVATTKDENGLLDVIYDRVKEKNYFKNIYKANAGCIITAHSGPNAYAIIYLDK